MSKLFFLLSTFTTFAPYFTHTMTPYCNIFIDLDDTIWDFNANSHVALDHTYHDLHLQELYPDQQQFTELYYNKNRELWTLYHHGKIAKDFLVVERFAHLLRQIGHNDPNDAFAKRLNQYYLDTLARQQLLVPYAVELLEYLKQQHYRLFILSNGFIEVQHRKLQAAGIDHYFSRIVLSDEIGVTKPARELFDYALQVTDSQAGNTLLIGDNYDADILGAMNAGWGQIYFDRFGNGYNGTAPQHHVQSLQEVIAIL